MGKHLLEIDVPGVAKGAKVFFTDGRPHHYLMMHLVADEHAQANVFQACRGMLKVLQARAGVFWGKESSLFPEARTYQDWGGHFLWEFWWNDGTPWDVDGLWEALNTGPEGTFEDLFQAQLRL